jgi:hypothetical protein
LLLLVVLLMMLAPFDRDCKPSRRSRAHSAASAKLADILRREKAMAWEDLRIQAHPADQDAVVARRSNVGVGVEVDLEPIWIGFGAQARYFISLVALARRNNNDKNREWGRHSLPT